MNEKCQYLRKFSFGAPSKIPYYLQKASKSYKAGSTAFKHQCQRHFMNPWLTAPVRSLKVMVSDLSQFRGLLQQSHQSLHKDRQYLRAGITQRPYYIQQKGNGLVSSPAFSISWWCYTRSCSSEAQRHWHSLWSPALLMLMKMRFIISNTTGSQYAIQNANVILDCSQTRGEVLGNEWRWLKSIHADKKKKKLKCPPM